MTSHDQAFFSVDGDVLVPSPLARQATAGPPAFQVWRRPVSEETPSRFGPRHPGHPTEAGVAPREKAAAVTAQAKTAWRPDMKTSASVRFETLDCATSRAPLQVKVRGEPRSKPLEVDPRPLPHDDRRR